MAIFRVSGLEDGEVLVEELVTVDRLQALAIELEGESLFNEALSYFNLLRRAKRDKLSFVWDASKFSHFADLPRALWEKLHPNQLKSGRATLVCAY